jgi:hypothetical protein
MVSFPNKFGQHTTIISREKIGVKVNNTFRNPKNIGDVYH